MSIAFIDIFFIVIIVIFSVLVAIKGFVAEFFGKAAFIIALICAIVFFDMATPLVFEFVPVPVLPSILAFLIIFSAVFIVLKTIQFITKRLFFTGAIMGSLDRSLGFLLGLFEGVIVCAVICVIIQIQPFLDISSVLANSFFFAVFQPILGLEPIIIPADPSEVIKTSESLLLYNNVYIG